MAKEDFCGGRVGEGRFGGKSRIQLGGLEVGHIPRRSAEMGLRLVCLSNHEWTCLVAARSA